MTKTERNKLNQEKKQEGTVLVLIKLYDPRFKKNVWTVKRVKKENVRFE
jgi:hypothetical protein